MKDNYKFEIIDDRTITYTSIDNNDTNGGIKHLDNKKDQVEILFTDDNRIKDIEVTFINRDINNDSIAVEKERITKKESLDDYQTPNSSNYLLNYSNNNLNIVLSAEDNEIKSFYEDGTITYYFNENNELVMIEKKLGEEEKDYFDYFISPLPVKDPNAVLNEISNREGLSILEASFLGDESWEEKEVNSYYYLRFIYNDKDKPQEIAYPCETNADIKGIGVRELFKRLEDGDPESYEMLFSGNQLLTNDYITEIRNFTIKNINYNNILRRYLEKQKRIVNGVKEGDIIPTNLFLDFIRRTQLMRSIEFYKRFPLMTYDFVFEDEALPYIGALTPLKDRLLEYKKENPLIKLDENQIKLMEHLTDYTVPDNDDYNYDIAARDKLLSKADDLSKTSHKKI